MVTWTDVAIVAGSPIALALLGILAFDVLVYHPVLNKIKRSRHPLRGAGHFAAGCGVALAWGIVLAVVCLCLYGFLKSAMGV